MNRISRFVVWVSVAAFAVFFTLTSDGSETGTQYTFPEFQTIKLENGITVLLMERREVPLVSLQWVLQTGGAVNDPVEKEGLAEVTAQMLRKGTTSMTADQISEAIDFVGGRLDASATREFAAGAGEFMGKDVNMALQLVAEMLQKPTFPDQEVKKLTEQEIDSIKQAKMTPQAVIGRYFSHFLMKEHPYGRPVGGTELSLANISRADVVSFHQKNYSPAGLFLAVVGDISRTQVEKRMRELFGQWNVPLPPKQGFSPPARVNGRRIFLVDKPDATQTFFRLGDIGLERTNKDWVAAEVVNTLFGGRFTSMLNTALRIQSGLTYGARSGFSESTLPGEFAISSFTQNEKTDMALKMTLDVVQGLHEKSITEEQLRSAKAYMKGQFGPQLETNDQLASALCEIHFYGLGVDYYNQYFNRINAVTLSDAARVIDDYFGGTNFAMVLIGQMPIIEPVARNLASEVSKKGISEPGF